MMRLIITEMNNDDRESSLKIYFTKVDEILISERKSERPPSPDSLKVFHGSRIKVRRAVPLHSALFL